MNIITVLSPVLIKRSTPRRAMGRHSTFLCSHVHKRSHFSQNRNSIMLLHFIWVCDVEEIVVVVERSTRIHEVGERRRIVSQNNIL